MRYEAVIFDLFGTLVDNISGAAYRQAKFQMSELLHVPHEAFSDAWSQKTNERMTGVFGDMEGNIKGICEVIGRQPDLAGLAEAIRIRLDLSRRSLTPKADAIETLQTLWSLGHKVGMITDCTAEIPLLWPETEFASLISSPIFSCSVGVKKPDPRIYQMACEMLDVQSDQCLYVGDGNSHELEGATRAGMTAVLIKSHCDWKQPEVDTWTGPAISKLQEVLDLLCASKGGHGG